MEEGTIAKWHKKEGDQIQVGDTLFEITTDKATVEHNALDAGYLRKILVKEGGSALVNQAVAILTEKREESIESYEPQGVKPEAVVPLAVTLSSAPVGAAPAQPATRGLSQPAFVPEPPLAHYAFPGPEGLLEGRIAASPLAKKLAAEQNIDLSTVKGTGPQGRIVQRDLSLGQPNTTVTFGRRETPSLPPGSYEEESLSPMRKVIAQRLQESKTFIPHFYVSQQVSVDDLVHLRTQLQSVGLKLSYNDFILRAAALALREHPSVNAGFNSVNQTIIRFKTIDISVAVSLPAGLITPIIRHADFKNVGQLSQEMKLLAVRAKEGSLTQEEYKGGSFTVSNLGMYGISTFNAIINPPQAAILAVGGMQDLPVVKAGHVVAGKVISLTVSADHRVLDGSEVALFLKTLQKYLENPSLLLL
jgi:pyruvate dehydrogenase E2 component (dihydrolipoamide acetyltransferase)